MRMRKTVNNNHSYGISRRSCECLDNVKTYGYLPLLHLLFCSQVNEELFESGAIAQVIKDIVDDVNCISSVSGFSNTFPICCGEKAVRTST